MKRKLLNSIFILFAVFSMSACGLASIIDGSKEHSHTYKQLWSYDDTYHWHDCSECDEIKDKSEHTFGSWNVYMQPTETQKGRKYQTCSICNYTRYEDVDIVNHEHVWDMPTYTWKYDYSTCTAKRECTINRYHVEEETVDSTFKVINEPTTESDGLGRYTATFTNPVFAEQNHDVVIDKLAIGVTGVELVTTELALSIGDTYILIEMISPSNASNKNVIWSSSDSNVVSVSKSGLVTANSKGNAIITVKTEDGGFEASCAVEVADISVTGVSLLNPTLSLVEGKTSTLYATVSPSSATNKSVIWSSDDSSIATVNKNGLVTAVKKGNTIIRATTVDGGFVATCQLEVLEKENFSYVVGDTVVEIFDYVTSYSSSKKIKVYTPITNNGNVNIYIPSCTIDIEDGKGNLKMSLSYVDAKPNIIRPNETTYLYYEGSYDGDVFEGLVCIPHPSIKNGKSANSTRYQLTNISFKEDTFYTVKAIGKMNNNSSNPISLPTIAILIFDKEDKFVTVLTKIITDDVNPGEAISFEAYNTSMLYHNNFKISDIGRYEAYAYEYTIVI